jgi:divalent metal cation (Fe/Co/Zn/Cd) transporter
MSGKASKVSTEISLDERMTVKNVDDIHHKWQALISKNTK